MNKGRLIYGIGLIVLAATIFFVANNANIGIHINGIAGSEDNGKKVVKSENLEGIHTLQADGIVNVHISTGNSESVRYEYNPEKFENESTFEDGKLSVKFYNADSGFKLFGASNSKVDVYVTVKKLNQIEMNGIGSVKTTNKLIADDIQISNNGTGSMKIEIESKTMSALNDGVGALQIKGAVETATLKNLGVGSLQADELNVQILQAENNGVGSMHVYAEKEISLSNSGVGSLQYSGDAAVKSQHSEGVGRISKN